MQPPDWYIDQPHVEDGDEFYLTAHKRLSTCRSASMAIGEIPWTAVVQYGQHVGFDDNMCDALVIVIETMDAAFRKWHNDNAEPAGTARIGNTTKAK